MFHLATDFFRPLGSIGVELRGSKKSAFVDLVSTSILTRFQVEEGVFWDAWATFHLSSDVLKTLLSPRVFGAERVIDT